MRVVSLGSGSKGNAYCVIDGDAALLVDCGLSCRELVCRAGAALTRLDNLLGVLFTHNHDDHIRGLKTFRKCFPLVPLFANGMTAEAIAWRLGMDEMDFETFENRQCLQLEHFRVTPFPVPHDAADPVGFEICSDLGGRVYYHATDTGTATIEMAAFFSNADIATVESNHDPVMLRTSGRPSQLIQRIAGPRGHLSNDDAGDFVARNASPRLRRLAIAHVSSDCNTPHMALGNMSGALASAGRGDVALTLFGQDAPAFMEY